MKKIVVVVIFLFVFCFFLMPTLVIAAEELEVCGSEITKTIGPYGEDTYQISVPAGIHLIIEMDTSQFHSDLFIKYGSIPEQDCNTDDDCDTGDYDAEVEIESTQEGYYYVLVDSDTSSSFDYTISAFGSSCSGLDVDVLLNQSEFRTGDTLTVQVHSINNDSIQYIAEAKRWIYGPDGSFFRIFRPLLVVAKIEPNSDSTRTILTYQFDGTETSGEYKVEIKLIDPITANYYTKDVNTFNFIP